LHASDAIATTTPTCASRSINCGTLHPTHQEVKYLGLSVSVAEKLARFILDRVTTEATEDGTISAHQTLTHEEIAEMIGASRETVTRLFASFKKKKLIEVRGSTLVIKNKADLEKLVNFKNSVKHLNET
jgi:CRP-like cAMP-binding protein